MTAKSNIGTAEFEDLAQHSREDAVATLAKENNNTTDWWEADQDEISRINDLFGVLQAPAPLQTSSPTPTPTATAIKSMDNNKSATCHKPNIPMVGGEFAVCDDQPLLEEDPATKPMLTASSDEGDIESNDVEKFLEIPSLKSHAGDGDAGGGDDDDDLVSALSEDIYSLIFTAKLCGISFFFSVLVFGIQGGILVLIRTYRFI